MNSIVCLLERTAAQLPQAVALEDSNGEITYKALRTAARIAATALLAHGVKKGGPVAVYLPKSCASVVSFYAALYCGAPYAPLDYTAPANRTEKTLQNLRPSCIITNEEGRGKLQSLDLPDSLLLDYVTLTAGQEDEEALYRTVDATVVYLRFHRHPQGRGDSPPGRAGLCRLHRRELRHLKRHGDRPPVWLPL